MKNNLDIKNYILVTLVLLIFSIISVKISLNFYSDLKKIQNVKTEWKVEKQRTGTVVGKMTEEFKDGTVKKTAFVRVERKLLPITTDSNYEIGNVIKINLTNEKIYKKEKMQLVSSHLVHCIVCILIFLPLFVAVMIIFRQIVKNSNRTSRWRRFAIKLPLFVSIISATIVFALSIYSIMKFG